MSEAELKATILKLNNLLAKKDEVIKTHASARQQLTKQVEAQELKIRELGALLTIKQLKNDLNKQAEINQCITN